MKTVAILQSNYIPWKGYFDLINMSDEFILYDDMQYTKRDWRNRNRIKTVHGLQWLTIPVTVKGKYLQKINEVKISDKTWAKKHWQQIKQSYSNSKYFILYKKRFEELYLTLDDEKLSKINYQFICLICEILEIHTEIRFSSEFRLIDGQSERLLDICEQCNADIYLSGPSAKNYFNENLALKKGIKVNWMDYTGYKDYNQLNGLFEHGVSVLDLIFNEGPNAKKFMKSFL